MTLLARWAVALLAMTALAGSAAACGEDSRDSGGGDLKAREDGGSSTGSGSKQDDGGGTGSGGKQDDGGNGDDGGKAGQEEGTAEPETDNEVLLGPALQCRRADGEPASCPKRVVSFGAVALGGSRTQAFTLTTLTGDARKITSVSIDGDDAADFALDLGSCAIGDEV